MNLTTSPSDPRCPPATYGRGLHRLAVLTAILVFPLILSGGAVTSMKVGMADPEWPSLPWYLLVVSWAETAATSGIGFLIEHGHRQIGWIVGVLTLGLTFWLWRSAPQRWQRWLGLAVLVGVSLQGLLGGLRVVLNAPYGIEFAMVHGFFAQVVFCLFVVTALVLSRRWNEGMSFELEEASRLQRLCLLVVLLLLVQLVLGILLRQTGFGLEWHVIMALAVAGHAMMLAVRLFALPRSAREAFGKAPALLTCLLVAQLFLGAGAWLQGAGKGAFHHEAMTPAALLLTTAHVATGALLLATAVVLTLRAYRHLAMVPKVTAIPLRTGEGAA